LKNISNDAQYIVITADELSAGAQELADYRADRGLSTMVATLTDVFDEFSAGVYDPYAIRDFIAYALDNWASAPQYVVLVGHGTYDFKKFYEQNSTPQYPIVIDNLIPVITVKTPYGIYSSDNIYGDVDGDGLLDIALGRIPAKTDAEVRSVIAKIDGYETGFGVNDKQHVLMVADKPDGVVTNNFPKDSDAVATLVSEDFSTEKIYYPGLDQLDMRDQFVAEINSGARIVNYIGHGGYDRMSDFFTLWDQGLLANSQYPVYVALTCLVGGFDFPFMDSLGEDLMLKDGTGFVAAWAPTGLSINSEAVKMNQELFTAIFNEKAADLGHAVKRALERYNSSGPMEYPYMIRIFNLLGDPALVMNNIEGKE
jgi:hypothetical protein